MRLVAALALLLVGAAEPARVLVLVPFAVKSHFNAYAGLLDELARRGHAVTVVSAFPKKTPLKNYRDITIHDYMAQSGEVNFFEKTETNLISFMIFMSTITLDNCEKFLQHPNIQQLIQSNEEFDLIIYEIFFSECAYGLVHKFKAPFIQISSNTLTTWMGDGVGNPNFFSYVPDVLFDYTDHMSFGERFYNAYLQVFHVLYREWCRVPKMEAIMRKYFPDPSLPGIHEIETNASFLLLNSHVSLNYPRPFTPNTAEVGGMHVAEPKNLPEDLKKYLDDAPDGVIYFSMGSHMRSVQMPENIRNQFLEGFSRVKQKVLWKWEADSLPGLPKNVQIRKWLPQNDILAHPNVKVFITHGGLLSLQEATYHGMPLVVVPVFGDQTINAHRAERAGYAVAVNLQNVTAESLSWALNEVLTRPSYAENAKRLSRIVKDQPQKPLDRAVFWVEYVIRHNGAPHMKSAALKLNFFQYHLLDVIAVVVLCSLTVLIITGLLCRTLWRCVFRRSTKARHISKSKKVS